MSKKGLLFSTSFIFIAFLFWLGVSNQASHDGFHLFVSFITLFTFVIFFSFPRLPEFSIFKLFFAELMVFLIVRISLFSEPPLFSSTHLFVTITEVLALFITVVLSKKISTYFFEIQYFLDDIITPDNHKIIKSQVESAEDVKMEFVRSRRYNRPFSMLVIEPENRLTAIDFEKILSEFQDDLTRKFIQNKIAKLMAKEVRRTDIIVQMNNKGRYLLVCPETTAEGSKNLAKRINDILEDNLGIEIRYGVSSFPEEAVTLDEMVENAKSDMLNNIESLRDHSKQFVLKD
jgi:hypothetical protein